MALPPPTIYDSQTPFPHASPYSPMAACRHSPSAISPSVFQAAVPSPHYWASRPAILIVQALYWLRDMLLSDDGSLRKRFISILEDPDDGLATQDDLPNRLSAMPEWMRTIVRDLLQQVSAGVPPPAKKAKPGRRSPAPARTIKEQRVSLSR
jgi:hypothetical protein